MAFFAVEIDSPTIYAFPNPRVRDAWADNLTRAAIRASSARVTEAFAERERDPNSLAILWPAAEWSGERTPPPWAMIVHFFECCGAREVWPLRAKGLRYVPPICPACGTGANPAIERLRLLEALMKAVGDAPPADVPVAIREAYFALTKFERDLSDLGETYAERYRGERT